MPPKKTAAALRKALTRAKNEEKRDRLELALLKAQEIKGRGEDPNFSRLAEEFNVSRSTLGHCFNGRTSKRGDGIKRRLLPVEAECDGIGQSEGSLKEPTLGDKESGNILRLVCAPTEAEFSSRPRALAGM